MAGHSKASVVAAVAGNLIITILKTGAWFLSGSGAMLSEAIHSAADSANQALLLFGISRADRPATPKHPYGFGRERYVWALISAMGIFVFGCGVTLYHGIHQLLHPEPTNVTWITWVVLGLAFVIDGYVLSVAIKEARAHKGDSSWMSYLKNKADPMLLAVLFEDGIAVFGILVASAGIGLSLWTGYPIFDGIASVIIALLLGLLAFVLALKNKSLLVGESAEPEIVEKIRAVLNDKDAVASIGSMRTRVIGAGEHAVDVNLDIDSKVVVEQVLPEFAELFKSGDTELVRAFGHRVVERMGEVVDELEKEIKERVPSATLIDIEED